jgi:A/G-specific adenine glycosylase
VIARAVVGDALPGPASTRRDLESMSALLPEDEADARLFNAAVMELGAIVCTARAPRCESCPILSDFVWRAAGYPQFEGRRTPVQKKFEGSDRQVRGLILAELRASDIPVRLGELELVWADDVQRSRALAGLLADGLAIEGLDGYELPR